MKLKAKHQANRNAIHCIAATLASSPIVASAVTTGTDPLGGTEPYGQALVKMLLTLGGFILALLIAARVLPRLWPKYFQKFKKTTAAGAIEVMDVCPLNTKVRLYLVRVEGQRFLISVADTGTTLLGQISAGQETSGFIPAGSTDLNAGSFGEILRATKPTGDR